MGWVNGFLEKLDKLLEVWERGEGEIAGKKPQKAGRGGFKGGFMSKNESEALKAAEDIFAEPTVSREKKIYRTVKKGEEIITREERQDIRKDGGAESVTTITIPVAACGKTISSEGDIAGFCVVCDEAICHDHANYCEGYGGDPCQKLLCSKHIFYFREGEEKHLYCEKHYDMRIFYDDNERYE